MKFSIGINLERRHPDEDIRAVEDNALELVLMAEDAGFETVWVPEHHGIEMIIAPNPLVILANWAAKTHRIRLGTATIVAPYWHPLRLAGEAAFVDLVSDGRLELGIARGAFQYEFDRLAGGLPQERGGEYVREIVPLLQKLWQGDCEHNGALWSFPSVTSVPKPVQKPHPPIWIGARSPETFGWAIENGLNIMSTPLQRPFSDVEFLAQKLSAAIAERNPAHTPCFMVLRRGCVYESPDDWRLVVPVVIEYAQKFQSLFHNKRGVRDGFPELVDLEDMPQSADLTPEAIRENLMFGTPAEVVRKLKQYEAVGVGEFCLGATFGLPHEMTKRSIELFRKEVMPHFQ
jgi:alkanesulfonate monooxygenase SsuD/methylene tetrahydromethanopterin reductase-like flavin-dependent oxidoreductase (luciferase family)